MWNNVTNFQEHTFGTPLYTPSSWYTPGKFWYTLGCTIHPVDKHWCRLIFYFICGQLVFDWYRLEDFLIIRDRPVGNQITNTISYAKVEYHMKLVIVSDCFTILKTKTVLCNQFVNQDSVSKTRTRYFLNLTLKQCKKCMVLQKM